MMNLPGWRHRASSVSPDRTSCVFHTSSHPSLWKSHPGSWRCRTGPLVGWCEPPGHAHCPDGTLWGKQSWIFQLHIWSVCKTIRSLLCVVLTAMSWPPHLAASLIFQGSPRKDRQKLWSKPGLGTCCSRGPIRTGFRRSNGVPSTPLVSPGNTFGDQLFSQQKLKYEGNHPKPWCPSVIEKEHNAFTVVSVMHFYFFLIIYKENFGGRG